MNNYEHYDRQQQQYQCTCKCTWWRLFSLFMLFVIVEIIFPVNVCTLPVSVFAFTFMSDGSGGSRIDAFRTTNGNTNQQRLQRRHGRQSQRTFITSTPRYDMILNDVPTSSDIVNNDETILDIQGNATSSISATAAFSTTAFSSNEAVVYRFRGVVQTGYGRGSRTLGFPTANIGPIDYFDNILTLHNISTGVYMGYATVERNDSTIETTTTTTSTTNEIYKTVVNIGYSPTFVGQENRMKIIEAHLIAPYQQDNNNNNNNSNNNSTCILNDFYNTTIRLLLFGGINHKIRDEIKFASIQELIQQITSDIQQTNQLLNTKPYITYPITDPLFTSGCTWIGRNGGSAMASYEIDVMQQPQ
jgi:riboflavin kinase